MSQLPAMTGWAWLKEGAAMFRKQPAALTTLLFADVLFSVLIARLPIVGAVVAILLIPSFSMAFMQACRMIEQGQRVTPAVLLTGFRPPALASLLKIGLVYLAVFIVLTLIMSLTVDQALLKQLEGPLNTGVTLKVNLGELMSLLLMCLLQAVAVLTLSFTAPLTYWQNMHTFKALFYSFFAVLRTGRAFVVLLASWLGLLLGLSLVTAILFGPLGLAGVVILWIFFLFYLLLQCALYAAYRQIFGPATGVNLHKAGA